MTEAFYTLVFAAICCGGFVLGGIGTFSIIWYREGKDAAIKFWKEEF